MNRPADAAREIRQALDREVRRRLDPERLCAALDDDASHRPQAAGTRRPDPGPLSRVPAAAQWIGIAAAIVAAVLGLRSLYVEFASPATDATDETGEVVTAEAVEPAPVTTDTPADPAPEPVDTARSEAGDDTGDTTPGSTTAPDDLWASQVTPRQRPELSRQPAPTPGSAHGGRGLTGGSTRRRPQPSAPDPVGPPGIDPPAAQPPPAIVTAPIVVTLPATTAPATTTTEPPAVQVAAFAVLGRPVRTEVLPLPEAGATLVTFDLSRPPDGPAAAVDASPPTRTGSEANGTVPVGYYARLLVGARDAILPAAEATVRSSGYAVVPTRTLEAWGSAAQTGVLEDIFDLRSLVALDGVRALPDDSADAAEVVAAIGATRYELRVEGAPADVDDESVLRARLSRTPPGRNRVPLVALDATLRVRTGAVVVLAAADPVSSREEYRAGQPEVDSVFVVLSPLGPEAIGRLQRWETRVMEAPSTPPVLVRGADPLYPIEAQALGAHGAVTLRIVVLPNGMVDGVEVLDAPEGPGADSLVAAAASAVRGWEYVPADHHGEPVIAYVTVTFEF